MGGKQDGPALLGVVPDCRPEVATTLDVHARGWLVEDHQGRIRQQRQGEPQALLLATGTLAHDPAGDFRDPGSLENLVHGPGLGKHRGGQLDRLANGQVLEQTAGLHDRGNQAARDRGGRGHSEDADRALIRAAQAQDHVDRCRLARPVRPEEGGDLAKLETEVDAVDGTHGPEATSDAHQLEGRYCPDHRTALNTPSS